MSRAVVVTGTDTGVGKTVVAAGLAMCLPGACYWKPVQAGTGEETDSQTVLRLSDLPGERILPEAYVLQWAASPHLAARLEDVKIQGNALRLPEVAAPLVIEGAGGLMVPLKDDLLMIDLFAGWGQPVVLVARTTLGTINHSLLSIAALRSRDVPIAGIVFVGEPHEDNEATVPALAGVPSLGRLPMIDPLDGGRLRRAMQENINLTAIAALLK